MAFKDCLLLSFFTIIITATTYATADLIQGCGGFVEASSVLIKSRKPTDTKLDYSHLTIELRTLDGLVKDRTQCAPNGYYFIPVYDKSGSFVIKVKGPEGWSWDPDQVPVVVDQAGCNANEDINFRFTGFTVSGRVVGSVGGESCSNKNGGPSNVNVELLSPTGDLVTSVLTSPTGSYSFTNIIPGKYKLRASRPDFNVEVRGSAEVELGFENGLVDDIFFVPGYDIRGSVVAQGDPILGVHIYLYSNDISRVDCALGFGNAPGQRKALCHAVSDAEGMFTFKSIPCGVYELIPYYKGENTVFDVSPSSMLVSVEHDHATVIQKFQVTGFSVGGRVVDGNGMGVDGVKIVVDGHERSITDKDGYYKLDQVTSSCYLIEAKKEHYTFDKLKDFLVLPNMASVVDIKAVSYDVCGIVQMISSGYMAKVALTHGPENVKPRVKPTDESGSFCFEVPSGEYRLSALAANPESSPGLLFLPTHVDVAQVNVLGEVACKEKCGSSVSVTFVRLDGKSKEERKTVYLTDESSEFLFPMFSLGNTSLRVKHTSPGEMSGEDQWCWEQSSITVEVGTEDVKGIAFVQKGYWANVISTHDVDAYMTQPDGSYVNLRIKERNTSLEDKSMLISSSLDGVYELPENILVDLVNNEGPLMDGTVARLVGSGNDQSGFVVYEYSVWANPGEKLTFAPQDSRNKGGKQILFYPRQQDVLVTHDGCQASVPPFSGRPGLYIEGSVSPPLSGVYIKIIAAGDSHKAPFKKGDLALETTTGTDGLFVGGPLYDDISYNIEASKPGYYVKPVGPHSFYCQKLGQISVHIFSKDDAREPFPSVLLSLSGENGYRNNSITAGGGIYLFENLFPGSFYLRPLLKEYAFSPPAQAIDLGSGEAKEVIFQATRVAYSVSFPQDADMVLLLCSGMGTVTLLSGQPKEGVSVEARSESKGFYEETITDSSGNYRLRGLLPDTTYIVKVVEKGDLQSTRIERASPESVVIQVGSEDIRGLDFLVFEQPELTILSGHVEGKRIDELHSHLRVEIKSANDPSKIESVFPLPLSNFFQVKDLPRGKHLLQLRSDLPSRTHKFESEVIEVDLEKHTQIHVGPIRYKVEEDFHKQELTPAPVYPLIVGVSAIALFISMPRIKDLYQATMGVYTSSSVANGKKEVRKPVIRKKTY
ncbi:unnamed protein product [Camellia sinensis]